MVVVSQLTKSYGRFRAVDNVSFNVRRGETFALLGPNGSGKTTILKCIAGLVYATSGSVWVGGVDLQKNATHAKALLSYLPQRVSFPENLTARELMGFYSRLRKLPSSRAEWVLGNYGFGFNGFMDKPVGEYSGGMTQRLGIAIALLPDVPLLILDEPAVNLDPQGAIRFRQALQNIAQEGKTILFSSHRLSDVELLADRVAVLVGGRLVVADSVARLQNKLTAGVKLRILLKNPRQEYVQVALDSGAVDASLGDHTLTVACNPEQRLTIIHAIEKAGGEIVSFSTDDAILEEMYLKYVSENPSFDDPDGRLRAGSS